MILVCSAGATNTEQKGVGNSIPAKKTQQLSMLKWNQKEGTTFVNIVSIKVVNYYQ
jgi:hypothetical protein